MTLGDARAKLDWAKHHFDTVDHEIAEWMDREPYRIREEHNAERTKQDFIIDIAEAPHAERWGLIAGDCVHNLRSALDHAIWSLAGTSPPKTTGYPILPSPVRDKAGEFVFEYKRKLRRVKNMAVWTVVEQHQPCNTPGDPKSAALWLIDRLDVADKHRNLSTVLLAVTGAAVNFSIQFAEDSPTMGPPHTIIGNPNPIGDGDTVMTILTDGVIEQVKGQANIAFQVALDVRHIDVKTTVPFPPLLDVLRQMGLAVEIVLTDLEAL